MNIHEMQNDWQESIEEARQGAEKSFQPDDELHCAEGIHILTSLRAGELIIEYLNNSSRGRTCT